MAVFSLVPRRVARIWGVIDLPSWAPGEPIGEAPTGEIWFEQPEDDDASLMVKLLFTAERLSIQVHPNDFAAEAIGLQRGKDEAWLVLAAEPGATIGLGLTHEVTKHELRAASLSGEIEQLIDWKRVKVGEVYYSPAGTVHAIGAGLTIMEIQQNLDLTYRLYDYGRARELHLDEGIAAADPRPCLPEPAARPIDPGRELLYAGGAFVVERWHGDEARDIAANGASLLAIPIEDGGVLDGNELKLGSVLRVEGEALLEGQRHVIMAYPGAEPRPGLVA